MISVFIQKYNIIVVFYIYYLYIMDIIDLLLILAIIYIIIDLSKKRNKGKTPPKMEKMSDGGYINDLFEDAGVIDGSCYEIPTRDNKVKPRFLNVKFHTDYRDTISSFNDIIPMQRQVFNIENQPIHYSEPTVANAKIESLVRWFLFNLNKASSRQQNYRTANTGWDEPLPEQKMESGWDKMRRSLGLPTSLYNDPVEKGYVGLVKIDKIQRYQAEEEIKTTIVMILQKSHVEDQMVVKVSIVEKTGVVHNENELWVKDPKNVYLPIVEEISIIGFMSDKGIDDEKQYEFTRDTMYDIDNMEYNNMTDPKLVMRKLMDKYKERTREMEGRNAMLDEEGRYFHSTLPAPYDYITYKGTRTIFDDITKDKQFS